VKHSVKTLVCEEDRSDQVGVWKERRVSGRRGGGHKDDVLGKLKMSGLRIPIFQARGSSSIKPKENYA
jgi:hypothetical protein